MINLLRGEFYKLRKSKGFYISCIVLIGFVLLFYGTLWYAGKILQGEIENGAHGVTVSGEVLTQEEGSVWTAESILAIEQQMFVVFSGIVTIIFISGFVVGEYGNGAIKNIAGKGHDRWKIFLAKYGASAAAALLLMMVTAAAVLLLGYLFTGAKDWDSTFWKNFFVYGGIQFCLGMAVAGMAVLISDVCRNLGGAIAVGIGIILFSSMITSGIDMILQKLNFKTADYWITDLISNCPITDFERGFVIRAVSAAVVWLILFAGIGAWHFQKADIK